MAGYATVYTMAPVFSLVLDRDVNEDLALLYPELYKELVKVTLPFVLFCNRPLNVFLVGPSTLVQDLLHLVNDQSLPRYVRVYLE